MTELRRIERPVEAGHPVMQEAARVLRAGGLVAFPTETVYGLGANGLDATAVSRIFVVKGRPADNPLILHVHTLEAVSELVTVLPASARDLAVRFWPGPLTMILPRRRSVPEIVSAGLDTVAVRIPGHPLALALLRAAELPVAAPSANLSGRPSPTTAAHVLADLEGRVDLIIDGGPTEIGLESTVLDLSTPIPRVLRPGAVTVEELRRVLGRNGLDVRDEEARRPSAPGMKYRHYAPRAPLTVVAGSPDAVSSLIACQLREAAAQGRRLAVLVHSESMAVLSGLGLLLDLGPRDSPDIAGKRLFALLRACDEAMVDGILAEGEEEEGIGRAVMNRLLKAAGGRVVRAGEGMECAAE